MTCGFIYKIQFPNEKHYIGLTTTSLKQRKKEHKKCAKNGNIQILYKALRKYDMIDTFELIDIATADTVEELCKKEIGYIIDYNSYYMNENGYNMTYGGEGANGYVNTEEDKQKMSNIKKKYFEENPNAGKEQSERLKKYFQENPNAGKEHSEKLKKYFQENPEAKEIISKNAIMRFEEHPEEREKMRKIMKIYYEEHPELREIMSKIRKKHIEKNPDTIKKLNEIRIKYHQDNPEEKQQMNIKISEGLKKYYENPEAIKKNIEARKKYYENNPNAGKKHSERMKKKFEEHPEIIQKIKEEQKKYYQEHPEERLLMNEKISKIKKKQFEEHPEKKQHLLDGKGKNIPFDIFTTDGQYIKTFNYQFEAKEFLKKEYSITTFINICEVLSGKRKSSAGFVFKFK
jgi:hypothetical protein